MPLCSCKGSITDKLGTEGDSGGWNNGDEGRLDRSKGNFRGGTTGDELRGPSTRAEEREREYLEREAKVCRLLGNTIIDAGHSLDVMELVTVVGPWRRQSYKISRIVKEVQWIL